MAVSAEKWGCNKIRELASNRSRSLTLLLLLVVVVQHSSVISVGLLDLGRGIFRISLVKKLYDTNSCKTYALSIGIALTT